ncbi:MAG: hypothetical protein K8H86_01965, partial [Ignavibacteriaceae bacterium]|nr:hypothetical protein [Ignavibacteriaceae bacterium]
MNLIFIKIFILLSFINIYAQEKKEPMTIVGDSLVGSFVNGETIREVYGNVFLTQGNLVITC